MSRRSDEPSGTDSTERRRIEWLTRHLGPIDADLVRLGIGDDAALLRPRPGRQLVVSNDAQIEGTHFLPHWLSPRQIGARAVHAAASDLAAMAAEPLALFVALSLPADAADETFRELWIGVTDAARDCELSIAGGNTSRGPLAITSTVIGDVAPGDAILRSGARPGDEVWVTGCPGLARAGYLSLSGELHLEAEQHAASCVFAAERAFRSPRARWREAIALRELLQLDCLIDLSDGLASDLDRLLESSSKSDGTAASLGVELDSRAIRDLPPLADFAALCGKDALELALAGGEDYELCFTAPANADSGLAVSRLEHDHGCRLTCIGRVTTRAGVWRSVEDGAAVPVRPEGFEHF